jgi:hypothetical protein
MEVVPEALDRVVDESGLALSHARPGGIDPIRPPDVPPDAHPSPEIFPKLLP